MPFVVLLTLSLICGTSGVKNASSLEFLHWPVRRLFLTNEQDPGNLVQNSERQQLERFETSEDLKREIRERK
jgi:hypothetical protein